MPHLRLMVRLTYRRTITFQILQMCESARANRILIGPDVMRIESRVCPYIMRDAIYLRGSQRHDDLCICMLHQVGGASREVYDKMVDALYALTEYDGWANPTGGTCYTHEGDIIKVYA